MLVHESYIMSSAHLAKWYVDQQVKAEGSEYLYNAVHQYYYDTASSMYYGGDPPTWTKVPGLPEEAKYESMNAPAAAQGMQQLRFP